MAAQRLERSLRSDNGSRAQEAEADRGAPEVQVCTFFVRNPEIATDGTNRTANKWLFVWVQ